MNRLWISRVLLGWLLVVGALTVATRTVSVAAFSDTTDTGASSAAGALNGPNAPASGVAAFQAHRVSMTDCTVKWEALSGGTDVANRFEVLDEPARTTRTTTPNNSVGADNTTFTPGRVLSSYRLLTRSSSNWVSPDSESSTSTCFQEAMTSIAAGDSTTCGITTAEKLYCWGRGQRGRNGQSNERTVATPVAVDAANNYRQVAIGSGHMCGIRTSGQLWCWGDNWAGQVGDGSTTVRLTPVRVGSSSDWSLVALSETSSCGIRTGGRLYCWGLNAFGQLGLGDTTNRSSPVQVGSANWRTVSGTKSHFCGVLNTGTAWCWGTNWWGMLGDGTTSVRTSPTQVGSATHWSQISAGSRHTCAITMNSAMYCWGNDYYGEGGSASGMSTTPKLVAGNDWAQVEAGRLLTCALKIDRTLWCGGTNIDGRTGLSTNTGSTGGFVQVGSTSDNLLLTVGWRHGCVIRADARLHCSGAAGTGMTSNNIQTRRSFQTVATGTAWTQIALGLQHSCAIDSGTEIWCWGWNENGQLGMINGNDGYNVPTKAPIGTGWTRITVGTSHTCGIKTGGGLWCWGGNWIGQLGDGTTDDRWSPVRIRSDLTWKSVAAGADHTCATTTGGALYCWGNNWTGQLGDGTTSTRITPRLITTASWDEVSTGEVHSCATRTNGTLWCWGANWTGQVGDGTWATPKAAPVQVGTATNWRQVTVGDEFTCATRTDNTLWCWGRADYGETGLGSTDATAAPAQVTPGAGAVWSTVSAGHRYACALRTSGGALRCWGNNAEGQFGNGSAQTQRLTPLSITTGVTTLAKELGAYHTCTYSSSGTALRCAGSNEWSQLGYEESTLGPTQIVSVLTWRY